MRRRALAGFLPLLALALSPLAFAQEETAQASARLEKIRLQVIATEADISTTQREFNELVSKRTKVTESLRRLRREDQEVEEKLLQVEEERKALVLQLAEAGQKMEIERERSARRLRALYTETALADAPLGAGSRQKAQVERIAVYSRAVRESDDRRFGSLRKAAQELTSAREQVEASIRQGQELRAEILLMRQDAERKQQDLQKIAREIQSRKEAAQRSLALLKREAAELEKVIASITTGRDEDAREDDEDDEGEEKPEAKEEKPQQVAQEGSGADPVSRAGVARGAGLFAAKASLSAPIKGKVVQHFGKVKLASFKDVLFSKGIEFSATESEKVHAVMGGTVAFAGNLPGYDTVVILDHGARSYSLYGRLGQSLVKKDQVVDQDEVVGTVSFADKQGRNFYFEVRRAGKPVDPESVLPRVSR